MSEALLAGRKAHAFHFASEWLGVPVAEAGRSLGRVQDLLLRRGGLLPQLEGLVVRRGRRDYVLPMPCVPEGGLSIPRTLGARRDDLVGLSLDPQHFLAREVLLDKQIVDVRGARVKRVNDVHLLTADDKTYVVHVDVGLSGLTRRLGCERAARRLAGLFRAPLKDELISWKHVQTLQEGAGPGPIRLAVGHRQLAQLHPAELAEILEDLNKDERAALLHTVDAGTAADVLEQVEPELGADMIEDLDPGIAADIFEEMEPSAAADILEEVSDEHEVIIKGRMEAEERQEIEQLQTYVEGTAGALMTTNYVALPEANLVSDALEYIRTAASEVALIHYTYLLDEAGRLTGVVSIRSLIRSDGATALKSLAGERVVSVKPEDSWEDVAELFYKYNFLALPVLGAEARLVGVISYKHSFDELVKFYHREAA